ncbi:uncharacterized protein LOC112506009 [Cynara cardunculus var. scolymus]|uniref:uncharacterized protein LOC112506009 n=1 Tax=Cynara cardunculus var. scolymus TaxID=59895 RepID=UPI000D62CAA5|nr:uncharacterized protein LOC112506009 [Cynara cardunculus var. scolymus]
MCLQANQDLEQWTLHDVYGTLQAQEQEVQKKKVALVGPLALVSDSKETESSQPSIERRCFILNDRDHLGEFHKMADEGKLLGYSTHFKAYKVFNLRTNTVMESINVTFDDKEQLTSEYFSSGLKLNPMTSISLSKSRELELRQLFEDYFGDDDISARALGDASARVQEDPQTLSTSVSGPSNTSAFSSDQAIPQPEPSRSRSEPISLEPENVTTVSEPGSSIPSSGGEQVEPSSPTMRQMPNILEEQDAMTPMSVQAPMTRWTKHHPAHQIIGEPSSGVKTRVVANECLFVNFLSVVEPKKLHEALQDLSWVDAMQEELQQFERNNV